MDNLKQAYDRPVQKNLLAVIPVIYRLSIPRFYPFFPTAGR